MHLHDKLYVYALSSCVTFTAIMAIQSLLSMEHPWTPPAILLTLGLSILINVLMLITDVLHLKEVWWGRCLDVVLIVLTVLGVNWLGNPALLTVGNVVVVLVACSVIYAVVFACMDHMLKREADSINRMLEEKQKR